MTIVDHPRAGRLDADTRCYEWPVPRLPLLPIYALHGADIEIIALFHTSRDPATKRRP